MISKLPLRSFVASAVLGAAVLSAGVAPAALNSYLVLTGRRLGAINGTSADKGHESAIILTAVAHSVVSPRNPQSGLPTGKRTTPAVGLITVTKASDPTSSPLFRKCTTTNELMSTATLETGNVWSGDASDRVLATLENAMIESCVPPTAPPPGQTETCTITYTAVSLAHLATPGKPPERILK